MKNQTHKGSAPLTAKPSRRNLKERRCAHDGCTTKLSQYNAREKCWAHADFKIPRLRGRVNEAAT
ncbi:MAG: hypothetical protein M3343_04525 [Actinomycetota bacterium]|jgi:hypothetical protein|nr:hypothetical protein [Actinomycetota bacterium]